MRYLNTLIIVGWKKTVIKPKNHCYGKVCVIIIWQKTAKNYLWYAVRSNGPNIHLGEASTTVQYSSLSSCTQDPTSVTLTNRLSDWPKQSLLASSADRKKKEESEPFDQPCFSHPCIKTDIHHDSIKEKENPFFTPPATCFKS